MRSILASVASVGFRWTVAFLVIGSSPANAQPRLVSLEELRRELAEGDAVTVVPSLGLPVAGRLVSFGDVDLVIRSTAARASTGPDARDVLIPLDAIQSLERRHDSTRNGTVVGAGVGAGYGAAMFVHAIVVDRNEIDEWAGLYIGATAICTGIGALIGWAVDAARSKPAIRFEASRARLSVHPALPVSRGLAVTMTISR